MNGKRVLFWFPSSLQDIARRRHNGNHFVSLVTLSCHAVATSWDNVPSTVLAAGAYTPEEGDVSLDLSMPKYDTSASADLLAPPSFKMPGGGGGGDDGSSKAKPKRQVSISASRRGGAAAQPAVDPAKAAAKAKKQAEDRAAKEAAQAKKIAEVQAKMAAKKAERAAIQGRRDAVLEEKE